MTVNKGFNFRGFISLSLTLAFFVLAATGLVLYIIPPGRVAFWINWKLLGMTKGNWSAVHTIFSFAVIALSVIHLTLNWRALVKHMRSKVACGLGLRKELGISLVLVGAVFAGALFELPPFGSALEFGASVKNSWEEGAPVAPAPHTELKTVEEVVNDFGMRLDMVLDKLEKNGVSGTEPGITLKELAAENNIPPSELYAIMAKRGGHGGGH